MWLRGHGNWVDFYELKDQLGAGSRYMMAKLCDPVMVEQLARMPEQRGYKPPIQGWTPLRQDMADIKDLLTKVMFAAAHQNPGDAPSSPRPVYPHEVRRQELARSARDSLRLRLVKHEFD